MYNTAIAESLADDIGSAVTILLAVDVCFGMDGKGLEGEGEASVVFPLERGWKDAKTKSKPALCI